MKFTKATLSAIVSLCLSGISLTTEPLLSASKNLDLQKECLNSIKEINTGKSLNESRIKANSFDYHKAITLETKGSRIVAKFSPQKVLNKKIRLKTLASTMGYDHFNWVSYVEKDPHGIADKSGRILATPYNDPPQGGYYYDGADDFPFYWDVVQCDRCSFRHHYHSPKVTKEFELIFEDAPADYRLKSGESIEFVTHLVGVKSIDPQTKTATWDALKTFRWRLSNPTPKKGTVSLVNSNVEAHNLSLSILRQMQADGAIMSNLNTVASCDLRISDRQIQITTVE